jgi:autophagy-related protein 33
VTRSVLTSTTQRKMPALATSFKFLSTTTLGLSTGLALSPQLLFLPALYTFPSAEHAHSVYLPLRNNSQNIQAALSGTAILSCLAAYKVSPRGSKHPYLLWAALMASCVWVSQSLDGRQRKAKSKGKTKVQPDEVNGEVILESMVQWSRQTAIGAIGSGLGYVILLVGIWGEGS